MNAIHDDTITAALDETQQHIVALKNRDRQPHEQALLGYLMRVRDALTNRAATAEQAREELTRQAQELNMGYGRAATAAPELPPFEHSKTSPSWGRSLDHLLLGCEFMAKGKDWQTTEIIRRKLQAHDNGVSSAARAVIEAAKEFRDKGTVLTACSRGACQRVIEHKDNSDPQAKLFAALKAYEAAPCSPENRPVLEKRPVAFRVRDEDGWLLFDNEAIANQYAEEVGARCEIQGLYARDGS